LNRLTGNRLGPTTHWGDVKDRNPNPANIPFAGPPNFNQTLGEIIALMKKNNPDGGNKLNFVVIGESESLQGTSVRNGQLNPRIVLKSPNSELMVTFNTDPRAPGYNTLEVMRWNGARGRYEFQEINFGEDGQRPHVDASGARCAECHKSPSPRPNWDTYRAWAGIVPSRDDMLEVGVTNGELDKTKGLQPDARAYLSVLDRIAADKDRGANTRLAQLEIPVDDKVQLRDYIEAGRPLESLNAKDRVGLIRRRIEETGFYRIKHFPDSEDAMDNSSMAFNLDQKTATYAGPSQFAFDQMLGQNMCRVATDLKAHPQFEKFKHGLAAIIKCNASPSFFFPPEYVNQIINFYHNDRYSTLSELPVDSRPTTRPQTLDDMQALVFEDTELNHGRSNSYKFERHERLLKGYLTGVERMPAARASEEATYHSREVTTPTQPSFHAIEDPAGVRGVDEGSTDQISQVRLLLEPLGVNVGHWSLTHGKDSAYNSLAFSDQFGLLSEQPIFAELLKEAGSCENLQTLATNALKGSSASAPAASQTSALIASLNGLCSLAGQESAQAPVSPEALTSMYAPVVAELAPVMRRSLEKCIVCHHPDSGMEFYGLAEFAQGGDSANFVNFLNGRSENYGMPYIDLFQYKLGVHQTNPYGSNMPPSAWSDNEDYAQENGVDPVNVQNIRRQHLAVYLSFLSGAGRSQDALRKACSEVSDSTGFREIQASPAQNTSTRAREE
jgi:hypothetical protein